MSLPEKETSNRCLQFPPNEKYPITAAGISPIPDSQVNGSAQIVNGAIQLTNGSGNETGSAFYKTRISTKKFSTHFTVQLSNALADGFAFCLQNDSPTALGSPGQGSNLGFGASGVGKKGER